MVKYCEVCHVPIADSNCDNVMRYIRIKYCPKCAKEIHKQQKAESKKRKRAKEKALATLNKEQKLLAEAEEVICIKEQAKEIRNQRVYIRDVSAPELMLRKENRQLKQQIRDVTERTDKLIRENWRLKVDSAKMQEQLQSIQKFLDEKMRKKHV